MYQEFFGFTSRPFSAVPSTDVYFPGQAIETARLSLARCIERAAGCGLIIGPAGTGKTLLCQVLAEQFRNSMIPVLLSNVCVTSRKDLLQAILFEVNLPYQGRYEGELRLSLMDFLSPSSDREAMLLIVDEAHALPLKAFEELRLLTNLVRGGISRVRLVLAGSPALEERLADPSLASLNQRTVARGYLGSFTNAETGKYIRAQTAAAGGDPDALWSDDALLAAHRSTDGVPRLINQLCDHTLLMAASNSTRKLDEQRVEEAWANLQQLPLPVSDSVTSNSPSETSSVVEFGSLDDDASPSTAGAEMAEEGLPCDASEDDQTTDTVEPQVAAALPLAEMENAEIAARVELLDSLEHELADAIVPDAAEEISTVQVELAFDHCEPIDCEPIDCDRINCDESPADEVVLEKFAGMEADNVIRLTPSMHALYVEPEDKRVGPAGDEVENVDLVARQEAESPSTASEGKATLASDAMQTRQFVSMSSLPAVSESEQATDVPDRTAEPGEDQRTSDGSSRNAVTTEVPTLEPTIFVDAAHAPQTEIYIAEHPEVDRAATEHVALPSSDQQHQDVAQPDVLAPAGPDPGDAPRVTGQNPLIPVRPGEYRQLFAKLRAQTSK